MNHAPMIMNIPLNSFSRSNSKVELGGVPQQASAGQEEGVLHSVLEDLLEGRVTSTLVDNPVHGV